MSNYLAIATVTATLQKMLQEEVSRDMAGVQVTTLRPDAVSSNITGACLNIYMYQATPNPGWRNADLRTRRPRGDLIKHGQAGLDLHYLFTFYGEEQALEPQRLMGCTVRALVDNPLLTEEMVQESIENSGIEALHDSTLTDQVQSIRLIPSNITTEELSRIWSVFFQLPYSLSFPYQATAILIQGERAGQAPLPVRTRKTYIGAVRPVITQVENDAAHSVVTVESSITIEGRQFKGSDLTQVQLGKARLTPQTVADNKIQLAFSQLTETEKNQLRAGSQGLQIVRLQAEESTERTFDMAIESNAMPFVLCPRLDPHQDIEVRDLELDEQENLYSATVRLSLDLLTSPRQRIFLILNSMSSSQTYIFRAARRTSSTQMLTFAIGGVASGSYLLRVQVDGAESPLDYTTVAGQGQYSGPRLVIA